MDQRQGMHKRSSTRHLSMNPSMTDDRDSHDKVSFMSPHAPNGIYNYDLESDDDFTATETQGEVVEFGGEQVRPVEIEDVDDEEILVDYGAMMQHLPEVETLVTEANEEPDDDDEEEEEEVHETRNEMLEALEQFRLLAERDTTVVVGETGLSKMRIRFYTIVFSRIMLGVLEEVKSIRRREMDRLIPAYIDRCAGWLNPCVKGFIHNLLAFPNNVIFLRQGMLAEIIQTAKRRETIAVRLRVRMFALFDHLDESLENIPAPVLDFFGLFLLNPSIEFNVQGTTFKFERTILKLQRFGAFQNKMSLDAFNKYGDNFQQSDEWQEHLRKSTTKLNLAQKMRQAVKQKDTGNNMFVSATVMLKKSRERQGIVHPLLLTFIFVHSLVGEALLARTEDLIVAPEHQERFRANLSFFAGVLIKLTFNAFDAPIPTDLPFKDKIANMKTVSFTLKKIVSAKEQGEMKRRIRAFVIRLHTAVLANLALHEQAK